MQSGHLFVFESELFAATKSYGENRLERAKTAIECTVTLRQIMLSQMEAFQAIYDKFNRSYSPSTPLAVELPTLEVMEDDNISGSIFAKRKKISTYSTPLVVASRQGNNDIVQALCDAGADPNLKNSQNCSPLIAALKGRNSDCVKTLLDAKASPHIDSPLLEACDIKSLRHLVEAKADPDDGSEALFHVLRHWREDSTKPEAVRMLLEAKADPNIEREGYGTPLGEGINNEKCTRYLLDAHADPNLIPMYQRNHLLKMAVLNNNQTGFVSIIFTDIDINELDNNITDAILENTNQSSNWLSILTSLVNHAGAIVNINNPNLISFLKNQNQCDKNVSLFLSELKPRVLEDSEGYRYIEKLEALQLALLKIHVIQMLALWPKTIPFAPPLIQLILEYDDPIPFIPKSPIRFFDAKSVNPALTELKTAIQELKAPPGFFETALKRINNSLKNESTTLTTCNPCRFM